MIDTFASFLVSRNETLFFSLPPSRLVCVTVQKRNSLRADDEQIVNP